MNVWEEDWTADWDSDYHVTIRRDDARVGGFTAGHPDGVKRAKLVAQAPAMARLLRELVLEHGPRHTFDWSYWFEEIQAVLDKAGVPYEDTPGNGKEGT